MSTPVTAEAERKLGRAHQNTMRLGAFLVATSCAVLVAVLPGMPRLPSPFDLPWWALALGFALAELAVFHVQIKHETHTFSLSEVPIVIGLLFAGPLALLVGRLVGEAATLALRDRQPLPKLCFNLSVFLGECTVALAVFHALRSDGAITSSGTWVAAVGAVLLADGLSILCVLLAIRWHGATPEPRKLFAVGALTALGNTTIAVTASLLLVVNRLAGVLIAVLVIAAYLTYRSFSKLSQRHSDLRMLYEFTTAASRTTDPEAVLDEVLEQAQKLLRAGIAEIEIDGPEGRRRRVRGDTQLAVSRDADALRDRVIRERRAVVVSRSSKDPDLRAYADLRACKDAILAPLAGDSRIVGTILVANRLGEVSSFDEEDGRLFETLANHASVALENGRLIERLSTEVREREHQATHDALTGLPNRLFFFSKIREHIEVERPRSQHDEFAVMLMDLDRFKDVNDTLGHHAGDRLLKEVAHRLTSALPPEVTIARLGGDEFAVLLPRCASHSDALAVAARLLDYLVLPCYVEGISVNVGASIGVSFFPEHGVDARLLLKRADVAMYNAKSAPEHVVIYDVDGDGHSPRRLALAAALREAIDTAAIEVHYQPKVSVSDQRVVGVEALARWDDAELGRVSPEEFIPVAEQTGLIVPLTASVLERALWDAAAWRDMGHEVAIAVNVAVRALADRNIVATVARLLEETRTPGHRLTLEVTETSVMSDPHRTVAILENLTELGVRISIDDFGTGYSSLAYLQRLPVHEIKIDRSFVITMAIDDNSETIVRSVVDLGRNLGLETVAEGVEDATILNRLHALGCTHAQGYFIGRPMPYPAFAGWLKTRQLAASAA